MAAEQKEPGGPPASVDHLAHSHQNVTIMFMDIVGEERGVGGGLACLLRSRWIGGEGC